MGIALFVMCILPIKEKLAYNEQMNLVKDDNINYNEYTSNNKFADNKNDQIDISNINNCVNSGLDIFEEIVVNNEKDDVSKYIKKLNNKLKYNQINLKDGYILIDDLINIDDSLKNIKFANNLRTGWVKVENKKVDEYTIYFVNCMVSRIKYCEYVDESQNILYSSYADSNEVIRNYKYEEEYRLVGDKGLEYTITQNYNTIYHNDSTDNYEYTGEMKFYNIQDYVTFGEPNDYTECLNDDCNGCLDCIKDWTRCIKKATDDAMLTGGVVYFPTSEYLVDLDDDSGR